jgi:hypothetical protein
VLLQLAIALALPVAQPSDADWQWLAESRALAFEHFMPVDGNIRAFATFRSYRDLYQEVPEAYLILRGLGDALEAVVVRPVGKSIQQQLLEMQMAEPAASLATFLPKVKVVRRQIPASGCPAVRQQLDALARLKLPLPERDVIVLHPVAYRLLVEFGGGTVDLSLVDPEHPAVRWATDTMAMVERCAASS